MAKFSLCKVVWNFFFNPKSIRLPIPTNNSSLRRNLQFWMLQLNRLQASSSATTSGMAREINAITWVRKSTSRFPIATSGTWLRICSAMWRRLKSRWKLFTLNTSRRCRVNTDWCAKTLLSHLKFTLSSTQNNCGKRFANRTLSAEILQQWRSQNSCSTPFRRASWFFKILQSQWQSFSSQKPAIPPTLPSQKERFDSRSVACSDRLVNSIRHQIGERHKSWHK